MIRGARGQAEESNRALWDEMARVHIGAHKEVELLRRGEEILDPVELRGELGLEARSLELNVTICAPFSPRSSTSPTRRAVSCAGCATLGRASSPTSSNPAGVLPSRFPPDQQRDRGTFARGVDLRSPLASLSGADGVHTRRDGRETQPDEDGA